MCRRVIERNILTLGGVFAKLFEDEIRAADDGEDDPF